MLRVLELSTCVHVDPVARAADDRQRGEAADGIAEQLGGLTKVAPALQSSPAFSSADQVFCWSA